MKRPAFTAIALFLGLVFSTVSAEAAEKAFDPCTLLTNREIEQVQGDRVASVKPSEPPRDRFAISQCFYTAATFSKSVSLEVTRRRPGDREGPREQWKQMWARALERSEKREEEAREESHGRGRERERESAAKPRPVFGVGDEAFWQATSLGGALYVLRGDAYFRVSLGGPEPESVKLEKSKKLARAVARRLSSL